MEDEKRKVAPDDVIIVNGHRFRQADYSGNGHNPTLFRLFIKNATLSKDGEWVSTITREELIRTIWPEQKVVPMATQRQKWLRFRNFLQITHDNGHLVDNNASHTLKFSTCSPKSPAPPISVSFPNEPCPAVEIFDSDEDEAGSRVGKHPETATGRPPSAARQPEPASNSPLPRYAFFLLTCIAIGTAVVSLNIWSKKTMAKEDSSNATLQNPKISLTVSPEKACTQDSVDFSFTSSSSSVIVVSRSRLGDFVVWPTLTSTAKSVHTFTERAVSDGAELEATVTAYIVAKDLVWRSPCELQPKESRWLQENALASSMVLLTQIPRGPHCPKSRNLNVSLVPEEYPPCE